MESLKDRQACDRIRHELVVDTISKHSLSNQASILRDPSTTSNVFSRKSCLETYHGLFWGEHSIEGFFPRDCRRHISHDLTIPNDQLPTRTTGNGGPTKTKATPILHAPPRTHRGAVSMALLIVLLLGLLYYKHCIRYERYMI